MNYRIKRLMKRSIAFLLTIAMLWSESSIAALASTVTPDAEPTVSVIAEPTEEPTEEPAEEPSEEPSVDPSVSPTEGATEEPSTEPTEEPSDVPSEDPLATPEATPTPDLLEGTQEEDLVKEPAINPLLEEDETAILSESELRAKYAVKSQKQDDELNLEETNSPAGVVISLWDSEQDQIINLDDVYQLEWYIYKTAQGKLGKDAKPVLIDEETLPLDEYTLLEDSSIIARLYLTEEAYQKTEKEPNVDYFDFSGGTYSKTEAEPVESTKASITGAEGEITAGNKLTLAVTTGSVVECYWFKTEDLESADDQEILISDESDSAKTSYQITAADIGYYVYAKYKLAGDNTLYKTASVGPLSDSELVDKVSAQIGEVSAEEGGLSLEAAYLDTPSSFGNYQGYKNSLNIVLNRNRVCWTKSEENNYFAELIITFDKPVSNINLVPQYSYVVPEVLDDGTTWKLRFATNSGVALSSLFDLDNYSSYYEYADGSKSELNIYVHDVGEYEGQVYLARISNGYDPYNYANDQYKYKNYTLEKIDTSVDIGIAVNESIDYVLAQDGKPYTGRVSISGEAVEGNYVSYELSSKDENGFRHICLTGKDYVNGTNKSLLITTEEGYSVPLTITVGMSLNKSVWIFENEEDLGDYTQSVNAKGFSKRVVSKGQTVDYYFRLDPSWSGLKFNANPGYEPQIPYLSDLSTSSELLEKDGIEYWKVTVSDTGSNPYTYYMPYFIVNVLFEEENINNEVFTDNVSLRFDNWYASQLYIATKNVDTILSVDSTRLISYDSKPTEFFVTAPKGESITKVVLQDAYKSIARVEYPEDQEITSFKLIPLLDNATLVFDIITSKGKYSVRMNPVGASLSDGYYTINGKEYKFAVRVGDNTAVSSAYINRTYGGVERKTDLVSHMYRTADGTTLTDKWFYPYLSEVTAEIISQCVTDEDATESDQNVVWFKDSDETECTKLVLSQENDYGNILYSGSLCGTAVLQYTYKFRGDSDVPVDLRGRTFESFVTQIQVINPRDVDSVDVPVFYPGDSDEEKVANAELLQEYINILEKISKSNGNAEVEVHIPSNTKLQGEITINSNVKLFGGDSELLGSISIEPAEGGHIAEITGLHLISNGGCMVDASKAPVKLNNCSFDNTGTSLLQISGDTYARTEWNGCSAKFFGGCNLLYICPCENPIDGVFTLGNSDLFIETADDSQVRMVDIDNGAVTSTAKWNVEGLRVKDRNTVGALTMESSIDVVNDVYEVSGEDGLVANSSAIILTEAEKKWLNPVVANDESNLFKAIKVIPEGYGIFDIPFDIDSSFCPYVETGEYTRSAGSYAKLLPGGYSKYVVFDINKKNGFPYGALVGKSIEGVGDSGYVLQYHADKTTEIAAIVEEGEVKYGVNSILQELSKEDDVYDIKVKTKINDKVVDEPIVLAFYDGKPLNSQFTLDVLQEDGTTPGEYLLTDTDRELSVIMNGGILPNYFNSDINFVADGSKCSMPDGQDITIKQDTENGNLAAVSIPAGTSGTLTVTAFYQAEEGETVSGNGTGNNFRTKTYSIKLIGVKNIKGNQISYTSVGSQYYGNITFDINNDVKNAITGISARSSGNYSFKIVSSSSAATATWWGKSSTTTYTVQYMLDLRDIDVWNELVNNPPQIVLETAGGQYEIQVGVSDEVMTWNSGDGLTYLFEVSEDDPSAAVFTGAVITDGSAYYNQEEGRTVSIPDAVEFRGTNYPVKYMTYGCLNEIWENGIQMHSPEIVNIPASVTAILHEGYSCVYPDGKLIKDETKSDLRKICVDAGNKVYKSSTDGAGLFANEYGEGSYTLIEIASDYEGVLNWPLDADGCNLDYVLKYTDGSYIWEKICPNTSKITEFICEDNFSSGYKAQDGMLIRYNEIQLIAGGKNNTEIITPEGVYTLRGYALKNLNISTLVLSSTIEFVEDLDTSAKDIYVYNTNPSVNPFEYGVSEALRNITFYGYVDATGNSNLKTWVNDNKSKGFKFVPLNTPADSVKAEDYVVSSKWPAKTVTGGDFKGKEYYEIYQGETLSETFDFTVTLKNGYSGKNVNFTAEWVTEDEDFGTEINGDEFAKVGGENPGWTAINCGIVRIDLAVGDTPLKTVYLVVRPAKIENPVVENPIPLGGNGEVHFRTFDKEGFDISIPWGAWREWQEFGLISTVYPSQRAVIVNNMLYDAWIVSWDDDDSLRWKVTPLLYRNANGGIQGNGQVTVGCYLFGNYYGTTVNAGSNNEYEIAIDESDNVVFLEKDNIDVPLYDGIAQPESKLPYYLTLNQCLDVDNDGNIYPIDSYEYEQVKCTILEGKDLIADAKIEDADGNAYLHLERNAGGKTGKAKIRIELPYQLNNNTLDIEVVVDKGTMIKEMSTNLSFGTRDISSSEDTITSEGNSVSNTVENKFSFAYEEGKAVLISGLIGDDGSSTILDQDGNKVDQSKLVFTISDTEFAKWVVNEEGEKTGILLNGEGSTLVTITSKDTNAASIRMVLEVKNYRPRLKNDTGTVNKYAVNDVAEYEFVLAEGTYIANAEIEKLEKDGKEFNTELFGAIPDGNKVKIIVNDADDVIAALASGTYVANLSLNVYDGDNGRYVYYTYSVNLKITDSVPKVTITADKVIELNALDTRETSLTTTIGNAVNSRNVSLAFDPEDKITANFRQYFDLVQDEETNRWSIKMFAACDEQGENRTPAEIVKLFNGKDIKLTVETSDYKNCPTSAKVKVKLSYDAPKMTFANKAAVTVNTADFSSYQDGRYTAKFNFDLTDGFTCGDNLDDLIIWKDNKQREKYLHDFIFSKEGNVITVEVSANVPKGTYKFLYTPYVMVGEWDAIFHNQKLATQELTVNVVTTAAKASLSTGKVTIDKNYIYTTSNIDLRFDENQIKNLYGSAYYVESIDAANMMNSIKLTKAPKNVSLDLENGIKLAIDENGNITVGVDTSIASTQIVAGDYTYSVTPYVTIRDGMGQRYTMALAPLTFTVKVTDVLPTVQLEKTSVTVDNLNALSSVLLNWNVTKGNYVEIPDDWVDTKIPQYGPEVTCENGKVRIKVLENTLKGTYEFKIEPHIVLDVSESDERNEVTLKPVTLKVTVNGKRPAVKLSGTKLSVNTFYPGDPEKINELPESAGLEASVNGYVIDNIILKPADTKTETLQASSDAITMINDKNAVYAVPGTETPKGIYSFYAYAEAGNIAFEPVKFTVDVSDKKPDIKLNATNVLLKLNYEGKIRLDMVDKAGCIETVDAKTDYLIMKSGKWSVVSSGKAADSQAYAIIETDVEGNVTVSTGKKASSLIGKTTVNINEYKVSAHLKGNDTVYSIISNLAITFDTELPKAILSDKKLTLNINNMKPEMKDAAFVSVSSGTPIYTFQIKEAKCPESGALKVWGDVKEDGTAGIHITANKDISLLKAGNYSYTITPGILNHSGQVEKLDSVILTISLENKDPDVKVSQSKVSLNRLDTRQSAWQVITFEPTLSDVAMSYDVAVKDAKGKLLEGYELCPEGNYVDNTGCLTLGIGDSEIADGKYKVIVTPTVHRKDGTIKKLKEKTIEVTVSAPKVKAALQNAKMTIDVADTGIAEKSNTIVFTGTNAELIQKIYWNVTLSKKPKGAGDDEIWITGLFDEESDGKEFAVTWTGGESEDLRWLNVTPGTYEFTLTPEWIEAVDGLQIEAPAPIKLSVTVKKTLPAMKLSKTSVKLNAKFGQTEYIYGTLNREDWKIGYVEAVMTACPKGAENLRSCVTVQYDNGKLVVRADERAVEGKYTFTVTPEVYKNGVATTLAAQKITVEVKNEMPVAKLASTKLTLNTLYADCYGTAVSDEEENENINSTGDNIDDMNRKTVLSLSKNYGESSFEVNDFTVAFAGKANQKSEAAKIGWELREDGTVAAVLNDGSIALGSYKFDITPVIRSEETGAKLTLKKVSVTVKVEKKEIKATAKASGKIDLIDRENSGIIYTVSLSDKKLDRIADIKLSGTVNGVDCNSLFEAVGLVKNDSSAKITVKAKASAELSTKITYSMQLVVITEKGKTFYVPVKIKPTQSAIKLALDTKAITLYKQAADAYAPEIKVSAVSGAKPPKELTIANVFVGNNDFRAELAENGTVKLYFVNDTAKAKYKANTTVKLPLYIRVAGQASDVTVKADITVTIKN